MFEVSFYTPEGTFTFPLSKDATSWKKARSEAQFLLNNSDDVPLASHIKDVTLWRYKRGKLSECHTWFWKESK